MFIFRNSPLIFIFSYLFYEIGIPGVFDPTWLISSVTFYALNYICPDANKYVLDHFYIVTLLRKIPNISLLLSYQNIARQSQFGVSFSPKWSDQLNEVSISLLINFIKVTCIHNWMKHILNMTFFCCTQGSQY